MHSDHIFRCRVCGWRNMEPPWGIDGKSPSFDFCECCGIEFGHGDNNLEAVRASRARWVDGGAKWYESKMKPAAWSLQEQLKKVLPEFV